MRPGRQQLRDTITLATNTQLEGEGTPLRAHVYAVAAALNVDGNSFVMNEQLRAIVADLPRDVDPTKDVIYWRGRRLYIDGPPLPRMMHGDVHHYTIQLRGNG